MERLTSNKKVSDMSMIELAHNSCYADDKRNARYRDYEMDMDARDFARNLMVTLAKDEMPISDTEFDEEILDDLAIDPFSDVRGLIALFYRNMWAMANLRETLKKYEDLEEQGRLIKLPCKVGNTVYRYVEEKGCVLEYTVWNISMSAYESGGIDIVIEGCAESEDEVEDEFSLSLIDFKNEFFNTKSEAEQKLKEMESD